MKKITQLFILVAFAGFVFTSCNKEREDVTKVINVTLTANEAYSYQMPAAGNGDDKLSITQQAMHYVTSDLSFNAASGNAALFQYQPAKDYTGTDEVRIAIVENHHGNNGNNQQGNNSGSFGGGGCQGGHHHHDSEVSYIFKITVNGGNHPG